MQKKFCTLSVFNTHAQVSAVAADKVCLRVHDTNMRQWLKIKFNLCQIISYS